jgi:acetyltransferase
MHDFERLIRPRGVAIVGASEDASRIGSHSLHALTGFGFKGDVYPVNPRYETLKGIPCYPDVTAVPSPCDLAIIAVPAASVAEVVEQCGAAGIGNAVILSAGFREAGSEGAALQAHLLETARRAGVRLVGPNSQGIMNLDTRMYGGFGSAFSNDRLFSGPVAMVTQSGGFGFGLVTDLRPLGIGFSSIVSSGNEADISALDLLEFFLEQDDVEVLVAFLEGIKDGARLRALGERALELGKPILTMKVGNSRSGSRAAISHTANLSSEPELYKAVFREGGFIEVRDAFTLADAARAFLSKQSTTGRNIAVITSTGGTGVLMADRAEEHGLQLPELSEHTIAELRTFMPAFAGLANPVDVTGQFRSDAEGMNRAISLLLADPKIDQVIVRKNSTVGETGREWTAGLADVAAKTGKPILISILADRAEETIDILNEHNIAWFASPEGAVTGAAALYEFGVKRERLETREPRTFERQEVAWPHGATTLGEHRAKQILSSYGIEPVREMLFTEGEVAALETCTLSFPVVVKVESADIPHKTEAGGVRVGIGNLAELKQAALEVIASARQYKPEAVIEGVLVQEMAVGVEMMLGVVNDENFGPVVALGLGGIFAETLRDITHRCAPFDEATARVMLDELKGRPILDGVRGRPPANVDALVRAVSRLSYLAADHADRIQEIDVNPLFVSEHGVVAADALIVLKDDAASQAGAVAKAGTTA